MDIKELIKRNMPVVIIGGVTALIFLIIIIFAQRAPQSPPKLIEVDNIDLIAPHTYVKGPVGAPLDVVEFTDFGCPACKMLHPVAEKTVNQYSQYVRFGVRHFPLPQHKDADKAAVAAQVAGEQGKFWEYSALLFENQGKFKEEELVSYADYLGLDTDKFLQDLNNNAFKDIVDQDIKYGQQIGVNATPTFFVNGKQVLIRDENSLKIEIENALKEKGIDINAIMTEKQQEQAEFESNVVEDIFKTLDQVYGVKEIEYTSEGLKPDNTEATAGQLVKWKNSTDKDIVFKQLMPRFEELSEPFTIKAGETFEFRLKLRESGVWTYKIEGDANRGSIRINNAPSEIIKMLPPSVQ